MLISYPLLLMPTSHSSLLMPISCPSPLILRTGDINNSYRRDFAKVQTQTSMSADRVTQIYAEVKAMREKEIRDFGVRIARLEHQMDELTTLTRSGRHHNIPYSHILMTP